MRELIPDFTMAIQTGIFFACWVVLHYLVFKPYLALLHARHAKTSGLRERAVADRERAEKLKVDYEQFMKAERKKVAGWTDNERRKVGEEERQIVQRARDEASKELQGLRARVTTEYEKARSELLPQVRDYSSHIASKLLGYKVNVPVSQADLNKASDAQSTVV